jgi:3'(2'), 5'-bisphosphate nucleotidase
MFFVIYDRIRVVGFFRVKRTSKYLSSARGHEREREFHSSLTRAAPAGLVTDERESHHKMSASEKGIELLASLVSTLVILASQAGHVIRDVQKMREEESLRCHDDGQSALGAILKDAKDKRTYLTIADIRAQKVIVDGIRKRFSTALAIVCEEDEGGEGDWVYQAPMDSDWTMTNDKCRADLLHVLKSYENDTDDVHTYQHVRIEECCVFIDPVDGTREFVDGRLLSVQTLLGVAWRGRAIAGVMGLPFHHHVVRHPHPKSPSMASGIVIHGIVHCGVFGLELPTTSSFTAAGTMTLVTSATCEPVIASAVAAACKESGSVSILRAGGCGNKILYLLCGQAQMAVMNMGTSLWDTCATEALLVARGGSLTTLLGVFPITYHHHNYHNHINTFSLSSTPSSVPFSSSSSMSMANTLGVVASIFSSASHAAMCNSMLVPSFHPQHGTHCFQGFLMMRI